LRQIAVFLAAAVGTPTSVNRMRNTFRLSADTIAGYIDALCSAYLFFPCRFFSRSVNERVYNPRKNYMIDPGMRSAVLGTTNLGTDMENLLALHYHKNTDIWYWKSGVEVDFVIGDGEAALESKYKNRIAAEDIRGGLMFAREHGLERLYVATEELGEVREIEGIQVHLIPSTHILLGRDGPDL
jgi:predicted AAA+ superfamily ATPase